VGLLRSFLISLVVFGAFLSRTEVLAWEGPEDNKPEAELLEMDDATLAWEARGPCVKASITSLVATHESIAKRKDALRYLTAIVTMKRKKDGKVPSWLYDLTVRAERGAAQECMEIAEKLYFPPDTPPEGQEQGQPQTQEQAAAQPQSTQEQQADKPAEPGKTEEKSSDKK